MEHHDIQQQVLIEHETLAHIVSALRTTIGWKTQVLDFSRKLSSLRFVCDSFQRHLKRLLQMEQAHGYMTAVLEARPDMGDVVRALRLEHTTFRKQTRDVMGRLKTVASTDHAAFDAICADLSGLLDALDAHNQKETDVLQEALLRDEGGEG
ncbi:MAG: hemerythrin domain-containing protein [Pirellulales bacterium]